MANIGFVGLGHMGLPMAINLIKAGHRVTGFDLQAAALGSLAAAGGHVAADLAQVAKQSDILITMLQNGQQVRTACLGDQGLYAHAPRHSLHIDCSTIDVDSSRELHQQAAQRDLLMVDAPVSGGVSGASAATLTFMVGGDEESFQQARVILESMGKKIFHTGATGSGQAAKICNNMILGMSMIGVSEAFVLAEKLGLSAQKLFEVVNSSSGQCWVMSQYPPAAGLLPNAPANHQYQAGFAAAMMLKDLLLSQQSAQQVGVETPQAAQATARYQEFYDAGFGDLDFSAIILGRNKQT
ncbi:3-hydroxyisobutyrate dehydrogenase [Legionella sp. CNM-4043-24]|uniref:3-hydroxyisobutyrate dehydrogenase n=1 Tax=Legionella sp. CNM-4043-24 TaxID=3421646 RepID=UPI00403B32AA